AYVGAGLAPAAETKFAGWRPLSATLQPELFHVPFARGNGIFAQQMNVIEISNVGGGGIQFDQGVIGTIDVGKEKTSVSSFSVTLIADVGDGRLELGPGRNLFLVGLFHVFASTPAHMPDGGGDLRLRRCFDFGKKQP